MALLVCSSCSTRYAPGLERCPHCGSGSGVEEGSRPGSRLPCLDVACSTQECRAYDVVRRVYLRQAAPGVVELPQYACAVCGGPMGGMSNLDAWPGAVGVEEADMPKVTVHGGASNKHEDASVPDVSAGQVEGSEQPSPGSSSETSAEKPPSSDEPSKTPLPKRVRTTGSRSRKGPAESDTARSTGSSGLETGPDAE